MTDPVKERLAKLLAASAHRSEFAVADEELRSLLPARRALLPSAFANPLANARPLRRCAPCAPSTAERGERTIDRSVRHEYTGDAPHRSLGRMNEEWYGPTSRTS